jgi:hypothetical protein
LMDRSRLATTVSGIEFVTDVGSIGNADVVVVDLARYAADVRLVRESTPMARIVGFGPHVDDAAMARASSDGADLVIARSRFFRDPMAALAPPD